MTYTGPGAGGTIVFETDQKLYVPADSLLPLHLNIPPVATCSRDGMDYASLALMEGVRWNIDDPTQTLFIQAGANNFLRSTLGGNENVASQPLDSDVGIFLNYDLGLDHSGTTQVNGLLEAGQFSPLGLLTSTFLVRNALKKEAVRLETTFVHDLPSRMQTIRLGDSIVAPASWGRALYFGGIQWGTDFGTRPDFITFPLPVVRGEALEASTAELYVNSVLRSSRDVQPGGFEIRNAPVFTGSGEIKLVVRDVLGRETTTTRSYFATQRLLRPGISDFSVSIGKVRNDLGLRSNSYGRTIAAGHYRRGLTNRFTAEVRGEAAPGLRVGGATGTFTLVGPMVATAGLVASKSPGLSGRMLLGGLEIQTIRFSAGAQVSKATPGFRQLGLDQLRLPPRQQFGVFAGVSTFGRDHLTVSAYRQDGDPRIRYATATYAVNFGRRFFWYASFSTTSFGQQRNTLSTGLTIQLTDRTSMNTSVARVGNEFHEQVTVQRSRPLGPGLGYRASFENGRDRQVWAEMTAATNREEFTALASRVGDNTAVRGGVRGAIGWIGNRVFRTRRIDDSFAVVKVGDYEGIPVLSDNQRIATTDSHGTAVVPRLFSWQSNNLSVDVDALPMNVSVKTTDLKVRPRRRSGVQVIFPTLEEKGLLIYLIDESKKPLPAGAVASVNGARVEQPIGLDGVLYLTGISAGVQQIEVQWNGGSCHATIHVSKKNLKGIQEETVTCSAR